MKKLIISCLLTYNIAATSAQELTIHNGTNHNLNNLYVSLEPYGNITKSAKIYDIKDTYLVNLLMEDANKLSADKAFILPVLKPGQIAILTYSDIPKSKEGMIEVNDANLMEEVDEDIIATIMITEHTSNKTIFDVYNLSGDANTYARCTDIGVEAKSGCTLHHD